MSEATRVKNHEGTKKIYALTGLRGLAATVVVFGHVANQGLISDVYTDMIEKLGVMIFFILSAYLMTVLYIRKEISQHAKPYILARVGRVFPLYILIVFLSFFIFRDVPWWRYDFGTWRDFWKAVFMVRAPKELWAVPVEVQFYALFLIFWFLSSHGPLSNRWRMLQAMVFCVIIAMSITVYKIIQNYKLIGLHLYLQFFFFGMISALFQDEISRVFDWFCRGVGLVVIWFVLALLVFLSLPFLYQATLGVRVPIWANPFSCLSMFILFQMTLRRMGPLRILESRPFLYIGEISYGVYLIHHIILTLMVMYLPNIIGFAAFFIVLAISMVLATASLYLFEKPLARVVRRL